MGLDQYLHRKTYVRNSHKDENEQLKIVDSEKYGIKQNRITKIVEEVAYWRKCNQIHEWFVTNVQNGEDDCREYFVDIDQLKELVKQCKIVLQDISKAEELLPTKSGFFFGGTEYDEWYILGLENTVSQIESIIKEDNDNYSSDFYYSSSW